MIMNSKELEDATRSLYQIERDVQYRKDAMSTFEEQTEKHRVSCTLSITFCGQAFFFDVEESDALNLVGKSMVEQRRRHSQIVSVIKQIAKDLEAE